MAGLLARLGGKPFATVFGGGLGVLDDPPIDDTGAGDRFTGTGEFVADAAGDAGREPVTPPLPEGALAAPLAVPPCCFSFSEMLHDVSLQNLQSLLCSKGLEMFQLFWR